MDAHITDVLHICVIICMALLLKVVNCRYGQCIPAGVAVVVY